ncbi:MAG: cobalamin biosynthesis protein, partial [Candidatus Omnitrophica bacterium]|nr:cobalamin biosynthesis protein [Candidatus Omnitrophota bacterium]
AKEKGLLDAASMLGIPIRIISKEEIDSCAKNYTKSQVVTRRLGIGGVCEPAALLGGRRTRLILKKKIHKGVTVAIARENFS